MDQPKLQIERLKFDEHGLIPAIVQDAKTRDVLTLAYMNRISLQRTLETGETWFWSRSRNQLWHKGETSGNTQRVVDVLPDCDDDALVVLVDPAGPACHTGKTSCFDDLAGLNSKNEADTNLGDLLENLYELIESRERDRPEGSYTTYLFDQGLDKILKKIGEESAEMIIAAKNEGRSGLVYEASDLIYHLFVLLICRGVSLDDIKLELARRRSQPEES